MNDWGKHLYEKLNLETLKTKVEILTKRREHLELKLDNIDNDFNKWLEKKSK